MHNTVLFEGMDLSTVDFSNLRLEDLQVTGIRDAVALPETGASGWSECCCSDSCCCCGSCSCCCSSALEIETGLLTTKAT